MSDYRLPHGALHHPSLSRHDSRVSSASSAEPTSLFHPHSKLSPPPNAGQHAAPPVAGPSTGGRHDDVENKAESSTSTGKKKDDNAPKRGYRACVHCRMRKAKCDLGDVNAPSSPPCSRCRREQRSCVFLPSKRRKKNQSEDVESAAEGQSAFTDTRFATQQDEWKPPFPNPPPQTAPFPRSSFAVPSPKATTTSNENWNTSIFNQNMPSPANRFPSVNSLQSSFLDSAGPSVPHDAASLPHSMTTPASMPDSTGSGAGLSPSQRAKRRRQHSPDATRRIVAASFSNETDALEILANAAAENDEDEHRRAADADELGRAVQWSSHTSAPKGLEDNCLVKAHILTTADVEHLVRMYFEDHHPGLPIFQTSRIPTTRLALAQLSADDPFLLSTMLLVASRHHPEARMKRIHESLWAIVRDALADYSFSGLSATVGFVEGVLILAEFLPTEGSSKPLSARLLAHRGGEVALEGIENRRSWALTGLAIRAAYGIGLDQIAHETSTKGPRTPQIERARSAWTWCYLYDRTIDEGLAFWSRGPTLCFTGYSHISQTGEAAAKENFPYMLSSDSAHQDNNDSASLVQALVELTQIMTNAHDILYPSKGRTSALVSQGTYFKYCDHFRKALEAYATVWEDKTWKNPALKELAQCTYHFVRLYVSSFAFQAHVQRAQLRAEEEAPHEYRAGSASGTQLFPRGSATSPDAPYIYDSIDAANEILQICLRLGQIGALRNLPSRYLLNFVYGGVFALKAGYSGATSRQDLQKTKELVAKVCAAMILACPDRDHPATQYGGMLRMLMKKLEQLSDSSAVPSRFASPEKGAEHHSDTLSHLFNGSNGHDSSDFHLPDFSIPSNGANGDSSSDRMFDFDVQGVNFNLDGFWEDFSLLGEGSGFPFK